MLSVIFDFRLSNAGRRLVGQGAAQEGVERVVQFDPTSPKALGVAATPLNVLLVVDCTNNGRPAFPGHERMWLGLDSQLREEGHNVTVRTHLLYCNRAIALGDEQHVSC